MLRQKILCAVLVLATALTPLSASAVDLGSAFTNLLGPGSAAQANAPGRYQSGARTGFTAGGIDVRVPRQPSPPALFSITPPSFETGCNGISAHFGGFSFISGAEFEALLKQIASGAATGFVTSLLLKTLCPACEAVVQELKTAAQMASRLARDSCQIGRNMADQFAKGLGYDNDKTHTCALTASRGNASTDALSAFDSLCSSLGSIHSSLKDFNKSMAKMANGSPASPEANQIANAVSNDCATSSGNLTWSQLSALDAGGTVATDDDAYFRKLLLINIMGADLRHGSDSEPAKCQLADSTRQTGNAEESQKFFCPPPIDAKRLVGLFMCGNPDDVEALRKTGQNSATMRYCADVYSRAPASGSTTVGAPANVSTQGWVCGTGSAADRARCLDLRLAPISQVVKGTGMLFRVNELLRSGVSRVRNNQPMHTVIDGVDGKNIIALMQTAPYPLYQAINAAAVYPSASEDLIDTISVLVAEQFAYALFDEILKVNGRFSSSGGYCISRPQADQMLNFIGNLRAFNSSRRAQIAQNFAVQEGLTEQIRQINVAIQRQVITGDMLASGKMAETFNKAVNRSITPATPPTAPP